MAFDEGRYSLSHFEIEGLKGTKTMLDEKVEVGEEGFA